MVVPGLFRIAYEYHVSIDTVSWVMVGSLSLAIRVIIFFTAALATIFGKRGLYFIGTVGLLISCIWQWTAKVR
jgi:Na+/melibiose symporter-like transporter